MLSGIRTRLLASHLLIALIATIAASLFLFESFSKLRIGYHQQSLLASAYALADSLETDIGTPHGAALAKHALNEMSRDEINDFAIFDIHGQLIASTDKANDPRESIVRTGVDKALSGQPFISSGRMPSTDQRIVVAVPMDQNGKIIGAVTAWISAKDYQSSIQHIRNATLIAVTTVLALSVFIALLLARALITPIRRMKSLSRRIATGDFETRVHSSGNDELAELASDLNTMASRLQDLENTRREFVGNVSHELRSPVSNIRVTSEVLERRAERLGDDSVRLYKTIVAETERLELMIDELLELSAIESGSLILYKESFELKPFLQELMQTMSPAAEQKHITIGLLAEPNLRVFADMSRLRRAILNLLDNAVKFTPSGGQIVLSAKAEANHVSIEVADSGEGIAADDLARVFERFYRTDRARSRKGGTGIGLAIVKHIVEAHGGIVSVSSTEGQGSTFRINIPRSGSHSAPSDR